MGGPLVSSISEIEPGLFIGNYYSSYHSPTLRDNGITALLSLVNARFGLWGSPTIREMVPESRHLWIECVDSPTQDLISQMSKAYDFIDQMHLPVRPVPLAPPLSTPSQLDGAHIEANIPQQAPSAVLVHCDQGVSRSSTIVIAYLMRKYRRKLEDVLAEVKGKRKIKPSANFMDQLQVWEQVEYQIWEDEDKQIPKLPYVEYKERRAAALKVKGLTGNEPIRPVNL